MFENLIGNEKIKGNLISTLKKANISHSYMFVGTKGIGKKEFAKEFAKGILCLNEEQKLCRNCKSCIEFDNDNNPDYYEVKLEDEENSIKIETIRNMQKRIQELPIVSNRKVYIIDDSEFMTKDAQNCLLKTLEEPPKFTTIILIVSNENRILNTIKSRCLKLYFNDISSDELKSYIDKNISDFTPSMLSACQGSVGKAININKNKDIYIELDNIFNNIDNYSITDVISKLDVLYKNKEIIYDILEYINTIFINKAKNDYKYINYISYIEQAKKDINANCNYDMSIDKLLFRIWN